MRRNIIINGMNVNAFGTNGSARVAVAGRDVRSLRSVRKSVSVRRPEKRLPLCGPHSRLSCLSESFDHPEDQPSGELEMPSIKQRQECAAVSDHSLPAWQTLSMPAAVWATFVVARNSSL